jgi:ketosteroid isomerase-like protein
MKHLFLVSVVSLTAVSFAFGQTPTSGDKTSAEQEVKQMSDQYTAALTKRDTAALERIWADDYTFINATGAVLTKAERLANAKSGATKLETITPVGDQKIRFYGGDVAVVIERFTLKGQYSGKATSGDFQESAVWVKAPSGWQLACNQITSISKERQK